MSSAPLDPELLEAMVPEFESALGRLSGEPATARRAFAALRDMAGALGLASFAPLFATTVEALETGDAETLAKMREAMAARLRRVVETGTDIAPDEVATDRPDVSGTTRVGTLIVDDSPTMRRIVRQVLSIDPRFDILAEAADGKEALERMRELSPALVMLDIEMPVLDGMGVLRRWALQGGAGAIVIVSSAAPPGSALARELRRLGAAAVVGKPSGALSFDLAEQGGAALLSAARRAAGLPAEAHR